LKEAVFMAVSKRDVLATGLGALLVGASQTGQAGAAPKVTRPSSFDLTNGDSVLTLLEGTPYVQYGSSNRILYEVSFRTCAPCVIFARSGVGDMVRAGFAVRSFIFAPLSLATNGEMASVAEIYRTRSGAYLDAWYRSSAIEGFARTRGVADIATNEAAKAVVEEGSYKVKALGTLLKQALPGQSWGFPAFIWRGQTGVRARFGYGRSRELLDAVRQG
jgi:hypothetical protein